MKTVAKKASKKPNLVSFSTRIQPGVSKKVKAFAKKNKMTVSQIVNSAIKVFISEAEAIQKEADTSNVKFYPFSSPITKMSPKQKPKIYGTADAIKAQRKKNGA